LAKTKIEEIVDTASTLYRSGIAFRDAVRKALKQHNVTSDDWGALYRETCAQLGKRGGERTAKVAKKKPQMSIRFPQKTSRH
jgi:hypothetical protein